MKNLWQRLLEDETGVILSSELALVGTVGVLGMVVGLEAVSCSVTSELNDLASAFGAINQSFNFNGISKAGHGRVSGSGFNDRGDFCDCALITQTDVSGVSGPGGFSQAGRFSQPGGFSRSSGLSQSTVVQSAVVSPTPVVRGQVIEERVLENRVLEEVLEAPCPVRAAATICPEDEIIEEHIIRRRVKANSATTLDGDCATRSQSNVLIHPKNSVKSVPGSKSPDEKIEIKPKKKG